MRQSSEPWTMQGLGYSPGLSLSHRFIPYNQNTQCVCSTDKSFILIIKEILAMSTVTPFISGQ